MIKTRGIRSAVLIAYAVIRADHDQRARELSEALGIDVTCIEHFDSWFRLSKMRNAFLSAAEIPGC